MTGIRPSEVDLVPLDPRRWQPLLGPDRWAVLEDVITRGHRLLDGRALWCVNSTAVGGGVAEMLRTLLSYVRGADIAARWAVVAGTPDFFRITKRIHNLVHGSPGDGHGLGEDDRAIYDEVTRANLEGLLEMIEPGSPVILHDPQTAGLVDALREHGCPVVWRSHIGAEQPNEHVREAWRFIEPYVRNADALVFSRYSYIPEALAGGPTHVIPPSIDAFGPKNQDLDERTVRAILVAAGLLQGPAPDGARPQFHLLTGEPATVASQAQLLDGGPPPAADRPLVLQVSRWDRLKDHLGVMLGFAGRVLDRADADLMLAGPDAASVADDPEGLEALAEIERAYAGLPEDRRDRIHIASLPMTDLDENAAIVNALQHHATIVVQKSLEEGFGLTVTEAMWKGRPMVASAVGGIREQIQDGRTGVLLSDPRDRAEFADAVAGLLNDPPHARALGQAGRESVRNHFLHDRHFAQYVQLLGQLAGR